VPVVAPPFSLAHGRLCILLAAVFWSLGGALTKLLREPTSLGLHLPPIDPLLIAAYRTFFAGLVLVPLLRLRDLSFNPWMLFTMGSFALMNATYVSAMAQGSAANAVLLQYSAPLWMYLIAITLLKEKFDTRGTLSLLLGMSGIAIIVVGGWQDEQLSVVLLALVSGVFFAFILIGLRLLRSESSVWVTILNLMGGTVAIMPLVWHLPTPTWPQLLTLVFFGGVQLGLPYVLMARGLRVVGAQEACTLTLLEPLLNPLWAYLTSPATEAPTLFTLLGGSFVLVALLYRYWPTNAPEAS
jgi:drug/metabolite transporter (DMT)-like permease